jgi:hypothetical protein
MLIKKRRKFLFFISQNRDCPRDNQIDFLFSGHFPLRLVIIKQAGYIKKKKRFFCRLFIKKAKRGSYQTQHKIGKNHKAK